MCWTTLPDFGIRQHAGRLPPYFTLACLALVGLMLPTLFVNPLLRQLRTFGMDLQLEQSVNAHRLQRCISMYLTVLSLRLTFGRSAHWPLPVEGIWIPLLLSCFLALCLPIRLLAPWGTATGFSSFLLMPSSRQTFKYGKLADILYQLAQGTTATDPSHCA